MRATEQAVSSVRSGAAEAAGGSVAGVEQYEVLVYETSSEGPLSGVADTVSGAAGNLLGGKMKQS